MDIFTLILLTLMASEGHYYSEVQVLMSMHVVSISNYVEVIVVDRFYIALFSALEQTHCARV